jgi:putative transposase
MARLARVVAVDVPQHVTQRGNARQYIFEKDSDRCVYLDLLSQYAALHELALVGYCMMSNHVHLVVIPHREDSLAATLKNTHGRYAGYWNVRRKSSGHVWQGRYYSCPLDRAHLWAALRYVELNPVRAGMVKTPEAWEWSSARAHVRTSPPPATLAMEPWRRHWTATTWREYLAAGSDDGEAEAIRRGTHTGRPLGTQQFLEGLEQTTGRVLAPRKGGWP